jgi:hypothetical protein
MRKLTLFAAAAASVVALVGATPAHAANATNASCEGVFASLAGPYAPGTVASLTHELQAIADALGVPVGSLNLEFARSKGLCF